jgi:hypothetical protein
MPPEWKAKRTILQIEAFLGSIRDFERSRDIVVALGVT